MQRATYEHMAWITAITSALYIKVHCKGHVRLLNMVLLFIEYNPLELMDMAGLLRGKMWKTMVWHEQ